ncbi:MAG: sarcosine oxidase subunit delta [Actinobacteria bacterium]|nr:sarcosine oxidase subunit delta [Actinomycetota bacterium]
MMLLPCPHCGPRNSSEFRYVGEGTARPDPGTATIGVWRDYLYTRSNPAGWTTENWFHRAGCRRYFTVERHTVSNAVRASHRPAAQARTTSDPEGLSAGTERGPDAGPG